MDWKRKDLKLNARKNIKRNYVQFFIVCLIISIIAGGYSRNSNISEDFLQETNKFASPSIVNTISDTLENLGIDSVLSHEKSIVEEVNKKFTLTDATEGVIATVLGNTGASNSLIVGVLNTINQFVFGNHILESTILGISTLLLIAFAIFVQNILIVGQYRFFLENKSYENTNMNRILFVFRVKKTLNVAYIMFCKYFFNFLWFLTIIGGFIKIYSYRMIPFILAENPDISRKDAFLISEKMMKGNKWNAFLLDCSFILWNILSLLTFGILKYLYINPLIGATNTELYFLLREKILEEIPDYNKFLNDTFLLSKPSEKDDIYPVDLYTIPEEHRKEWLTMDYESKYSISSYILIFFAISFVGWIWEVMLKLFEHGEIINRGTMIGPWLPIYGTGTLIMLILLRPLANKPFILFPSAMAVCGVIEYFTSWLLEKMFNASWWNYDKMFFNINGRVCLEGLIFFAIGGFLIIYFIAPIIDEFVNYIPKKLKITLCVVLILLFSTDFIYSFNNPNTGKGVTEEENINGKSKTTYEIS